MANEVEYSIDENTGIGSITLNRPEVLNAINVATAVGMGEAMRAMAAAKNLRVIVVKGNGRAFIAGGDLASFHEDYDQAKHVLHELLDHLDIFVKTAHEIPVPIVASVHGAAAGAGLSIVAACDIVISSESAKYVLAYNQVGAVPDCGGTWNIIRKVGFNKMAAMMYLGESMTAQEALSHGLITKVVADNELQEETDKVIQRIASGPSFAYGQFKRLANVSLSNDLASQLDLERSAFENCIDSADFKIGVTAFLNRQKPAFTGK